MPNHLTRALNTQPTVAGRSKAAPFMQGVRLGEKMRHILSLSLILIFPSLTLAEESKIETADNSETVEIKYEQVPNYKSGEPYYYQEHRLFRSYLDNSDEKLTDFFNGWKKSSNSISKSELEEVPSIVKSAYEIFEDFYQPKNLTRIGKPEWGPDQFKHVSYLIVQNSLNIIITNKLETEPFNSNITSILDITINNLRPNVKGDTPALYLTEQYKTSLSHFLGSEEYPLGHGGIMVPARAKGESKKRQQHINKFLQIYHGHWGGWNYITDPTVSSINFNSSLNKAIVHFSLVYEGGYAIYILKKGKWILRESKLTWIT